ncbi:MAG: MFS transporter [Muribaculaceae bacterium]
MAKESIYGSMDPETVKKFKSWQLRTIIVSMIGYAIYYFVRKNFSLAMPGLTAEYGISNASFGIIIAISSMVYGFSRFVNGFVADRISARTFMAIGLLLCAVANFAFGFGVDISYFLTGVKEGPQLVNMLVMVMGIAIIVNQAFQGIGYPPCARLLPHWIHPSELATKMSIWNTSHSIGAAFATIVCGYIMGHFGSNLSANADVIANVATNLGVDPSNAEGMQRVLSYASHYGAWKWCFWIPACIAVAGSIWLFFGLRDDPKSVGLPELPDTNTGKEGDKNNKQTHKKFLKEMVFCNRWVWTLCIANIFVYIVRMGILDWGPKFLTESRNMSITNAGWTVGAFEIFGIIGTIFAGWATDHIFKGKAHRMCVFCMLGAAIFMTVFRLLPIDTSMPITVITLAMGGFFIYGPQALIGIASANQATKKASATANGLAGIFGYIGSSLSALGIGFLVDYVNAVSPGAGWGVVFVVIIGVSIIGMIVFLTMWKAPRDGYDKSQKIQY